jgi:hypothetical protein
MDATHTQTNKQTRQSHFISLTTPAVLRLVALGGGCGLGALSSPELRFSSSSSESVSQGFLPLAFFLGERDDDDDCSFLGLLCFMSVMTTAVCQHISAHQFVYI